VSTLGRALAPRLAEIAAALDRYSEFAFVPDAPAPSPAFAPGEELGAARELVLRALRTASDPLNDRILRRLEQGDASLHDLATLVSLPRLALWERLNDLVQAGLVARSLEGDRAGLTEAGRVLADLVGQASAATAGGAET
jgi:DNA-binding HxlR family transcriptional regulator